MRRLRSHGRYPYSALPSRPVFDWPGGRRLAVYVAVNLECFAFGEGLGAELAPGGPQPDVLNYSWRDWGNRVGAFRLSETLGELALPVSVLVNSDMYAEAPEAVEAYRGLTHEIVGHGRSNSERQGTLSEGEEAALIAEATAEIARREGAPPKGWLGPWISESLATPDLLAEAGYSYMLDWAMDDQPVWVGARAGPLLSVPYPQELNDIPAVIARKVEGAEFARMIVDAFDEMLDQSARAPLVMGIALHPYIVGQPHRLRPMREALRHIARRRDEVWLTKSGEIAEQFARVRPAG